MNITLAAWNMNSSVKQIENEKYPYLDSRQDFIALDNSHAANSVYGKAIMKLITLVMLNFPTSTQNKAYLQLRNTR